MLHSFSFGELALVFGIVIVLFGGSRLASIGKSLGEGISNFKKGLNASQEEKAAPVVQEPKVQVVHNVQIETQQYPTKTTHDNRVVEMENKT